MAGPSSRAHKQQKRPVSQAKAHEILEHGEVRGHALTKKQRGLFGAIAGGSPLKKYHHSPDTFDDTAKGERPGRREYHGQPENLNTSESPKKAGNSRGNIQQADGTGNLRADYKTKSARVPDSPSGKDRTLGDSYNDTKDLP